MAPIQSDQLIPSLLEAKIVKRFHLKVCVPLPALRLSASDAICDSGAGKGERRRQAGGAGVPGAVETDLGRGQRHHRTRILG